MDPLHRSDSLGDFVFNELLEIKHTGYTPDDADISLLSGSGAYPLDHHQQI